MSAYAVSARGLAGRKVPQGVLTPMGDLLFSASEPGAWYDTSDLSTLFQDSAGTVPVTAVEQPVGLMLDKSGRGNHATQATTTKRPVLSRRVNLLGNSSALAYAYYDVNVTPGVAQGPDGGMSAALVSPVASSLAQFSQVVTYGTGDYTAFIIVKKKDFKYVKFLLRSSVSIFDLDAGVFLSAPTGYFSQALGDGWYLVGATKPMVGGWTIGYQFSSTTETGSYFDYPDRNRQVVPDADGIKGNYFAGRSLTLATDANLPYQWVNTATDYDAAPDKFPAYRRADGVDDSHASATGGGGTTGFFFSAAISPQGSAGTARTLFSDAGANTGYIVRLNASNQLELSAGNGTAYTTIATAGTLAVGSTDIVQAWDDGTNLNVKIGSGATASIARPTVSAGTAGYTMGQDNGASTGYFNGRAYSTIYRKDSGLTQVQREAVALYQRQKARMP